MLPSTGSDKSETSKRRSYTRPALVAMLLLGLYLVMRWVPVEAGVEAGGPRLDAVLLWCFGGLVTLAFLAIAARKS